MESFRQPNNVMTPRLILFALLLIAFSGYARCGTNGPDSFAPSPQLHQLDPPKILHVIGFYQEGINYISIEWSYVPGATVYHVYISEKPTLDQLIQETPLVFDNVIVYQGIITPRRIAGFETGIRYFLVMTAANDIEESLPSNVVRFEF